MNLNKQETLTVAQTILEQLGGRRFQLMTGAKGFLATANGGLRFSLPRGFAKDGITLVQVDLTDLDLYNVQGFNAKGEPRGVGSDGVYNDQLQAAFTRLTGLETRL